MGYSQPLIFVFLFSIFVVQLVEIFFTDFETQTADFWLRK